MTNKVINVGLYGGKGIFGGRETPLEASVISCDRADSCSYYQNGHCWNVRGFSDHCKFGNVSNHRGFTSRAQKYYKFKRKWEQHEEYGKLKRPSTKLGVIGDTVVFPYSYIQIRELDDGSLGVGNPSFGSDLAFIENSKFTVEFIHKICSFRPRAMMGGEITDYQNKTVPLFLAHLKEVLPEKYNEYTKAYPKAVESIDYVGRKALLKTIKPSVVHYKSSSYPQFNEEWVWDGESLIYDSGYVSSVNITKDYEVLEFKLIPSDKSVVKIESNDQVLEETIFLD